MHAGTFRLGFVGRMLAASAIATVSFLPSARPQGAEAPPSPTPGGQVAVDVATYTLGPGDVVIVRVYGEPDESGSFMVGPLGTMSGGPLTGRLQAAGLTPDQLRDQIVDQLRHFIKHPVAQVAIDADQSRRQVYVFGAVETPGTHAVPFGGRIAQAVMAAGILDGADLSGIRLSRSGEPASTLDLSALREGGDLAAVDVQARSGDAVYVPRLRLRSIDVIGMVSRPGPIALDPDAPEEMTVLTALSRAGGTTAATDHLSAVLLRADGESEPIDLRALLMDGDRAHDKPIRGGDTLIIQETGKVTVAGEVRQPGTFAVGERVGVLEALAMAGGFTSMADLANARVVRDTGPETVDLEALWWRGDTSQNLTLAPGESLLVPERDPETVLVVGAVEEPGAVDLHRTLDRRVVRVVQEALPTDSADLRRVTVHRPGAEGPIVADTKSVMEGGNAEADVTLQAGDMVFVPELRKVYAIGAFAQPGAYPLAEDMTLMDLVAQAGAFREDAAPQGMRWIRANPEGAEVSRVNFSRIQRGLDPGDQAIAEGDTVFVPSRKPGPSSWDLFRDALFGVAAVLNIFN